MACLSVCFVTQFCFAFFTASSQCNYTGQTMATCNFTGSSVNLTYQHNLPSPANISHIQWYYARDCQDIHHEVNNLRASNTHGCVKNEIGILGLEYKCNFSKHNSIQNSNLTISKLNASNDGGYYWCSVQENRIPNQVIHIQTQPILNSVNSSITVTILSYVSPMSTSCCADDKNCTYGTISLAKAQNHTCQIRNHSKTCISPTTENTTTVEYTATTATNSGATFLFEIVWVAIGVVLALLLLGVVILLAIIASVWCKKRVVKGELKFNID